MSDASTVRAAEDALREAQRASDVAALERLLDDTLVFTGPDGLVYGKADDLEAHRCGAIRIARLDPSEEIVQDLGAVVVISVRMQMEGSFKGALFAGTFRYTRVWRLTDAWRVVAGHVSEVQGDR